MQIQLSASHSSGTKKRPRFDTVKRHFKYRAMEFPHPFYHNGGSPFSVNFRTACPQKTSQSHNFRLPCRIMDDCSFLRFHRKEQDIFRSTDAGIFQINMISQKQRRLTMENLVFLPNPYAHFLKSAQMQVNGTLSDHTSARVSQRCFFHPPQQCPQIQYGRTHLPHHFLTDFCFFNIPAVNGQCPAFQLCLAAQFLQNLQRNKHIRNMGHIFQHHFISS